MRRCAPLFDGAVRLQSDKRPLFSRRGFTLLEICIVLFIIVLLLGAMAPAIESAIVEQAVRSDTHELSLMVKTAMLQSTDEHRAYVIDLTPTTMTLHPAGHPAAEGDSSALASDDDATGDVAAPDDTAITRSINKFNRFLLPNPKNPRDWLPIASASWLFLPGELCPVPRVRVSRGRAWVELSFNALTGNVEDEDAYFP